MNSRIGIEFLSVFNLPPLEFVELAANLGCGNISIGLTSSGHNPHGYAPYSFRDDVRLRRAMVARLKDCGVAISLGEGFMIRPGTDARDMAADLDIMCELGVTRINTLALDGDLPRSHDQIATLAEMARTRGVTTTLEFVPGLPIANLAAALQLLDHVDSPDCRLLIDTMHLIRSGSTVEELAAVDPARIGYVQISDVPLIPIIPDYMYEARYERRVPGEGELPLRDIFSLLPEQLVVGIEVPLRSLADAGKLPAECLKPCVQATEQLLAVRAEPV